MTTGTKVVGYGERLRKLRRTKAWRALEGACRDALDRSEVEAARAEQRRLELAVYREWQAAMRPPSA